MSGAFEVLMFTGTTWIPLVSEPVEDFVDATNALISLLNMAGADDDMFMDILAHWHDLREMDTCLCGRASCGNVIYPYESLGVPMAYAYYAG